MYLKIENKFLYVRVSAVIWKMNGIGAISDLPIDSGKELKKIYSSEKKLQIILDFKGVNAIIDHSLDDLFEEINILKRDILFINCNALDQKISNLKNEKCSLMIDTIFDNRNAIAISPNNKSKTTNIEDLQNRLKKAISKKIDEIVLDSYCLHSENKMKLLPSTPFYANGEYNATKIISDSENFIWVCLQFADLIEDSINNGQIGRDSKLPIKILSVTLRSSPFASAVSMLLNYPLQTIEYLGPKRNSKAHINTSNFERCEFIYIGDFAFAGTEIRITKMYAQIKNSKLENAFVIGSFMPPEAFNDFKLFRLIDLQAKNKRAKYDFKLKSKQ